MLKMSRPKETLERVSIREFGGKVVFDIHTLFRDGVEDHNGFRSISFAVEVEVEIAVYKHIQPNKHLTRFYPVQDGPVWDDVTGSVFSAALSQLSSVDLFEYLVSCVPDLEAKALYKFLELHIKRDWSVVKTEDEGV